MNRVVTIGLTFVLSVISFLPWYLLLQNKELQQFLTITMLLKIVFSTIILTFLYQALLQYRKYKFYGIFYLFLAGSFYHISYVLEFMMIYFVNSENATAAEIAYFFTQLFILMSPLMLILFISSYRTNQINPIHIIPTFLSLGMFFQASLTGSASVRESIKLDTVTFYFLNFNQDSPWYQIGFVVSFIYVFLYSTHSLHQLRQMTFSSKVRKQQHIFIIGIIFAVGVTPLLFYVTNQLHGAEMIFVLNYAINNSFTIIAIIVTLWPYIQNENPGYIQPQPLDQVLIIQKTGQLLYNYDFRPSETIDEILFSGAVTAVSSILKEATGSASDIRMLQFEDKTMMTRFTDTLAFVLIVDYPTAALTNYLDQFSQTFNDEFAEEVNDAFHASKLLDQAIIDSYTREAFGLPKQLEE